MSVLSMFTVIGMSLGHSALRGLMVLPAWPLTGLLGWPAVGMAGGAGLLAFYTVIVRRHHSVYQNDLGANPERSFRRARRARKQ